MLKSACGEVWGRVACKSKGPYFICCSKSCIQQHYEPFTAQRLCTDGSAKRQKASARPAHKRQ